MAQTELLGRFSVHPTSHRGVVVLDTLLVLRVRDEVHIALLDTLRHANVRATRVRTVATTAHLDFVVCLAFTDRC